MKATTMSEHQGKKPDMRAIKAQAKARFGSLAGVVGFGIGDYALRVYVNSKTALDGVLPKKFLGVPVNLIVARDISAQSKP